MDSVQVTQQQLALNRLQNSPDFELSIKDQPMIFKKGLFIKVLDPPPANPEDPKSFRTVTVKCTQPGCR
jgi:hypothetical protein